MKTIEEKFRNLIVIKENKIKEERNIENLKNIEIKNTFNELKHYLLEVGFSVSVEEANYIILSLSDIISICIQYNKKNFNILYDNDIDNPSFTRLFNIDLNNNKIIIPNFIPFTKPKNREYNKENFLEEIYNITELVSGWK